MVGSDDSRRDSAEIGSTILVVSAIGTVAMIILLIHDLVILEVLGWGIFFRDLILLTICLALFGWSLCRYIRESRLRSQDHQEPRQGD